MDNNLLSALGIIVTILVAIYFSDQRRNRDIDSLRKDNEKAHKDNEKAHDRLSESIKGLGQDHVELSGRLARIDRRERRFALSVLDTQD